MRKLLTLIFLLSLGWTLQAQPSIPSWATREYRPFYGKMVFRDTIAYYNRGTAVPGYVLTAVDSLGRLQWAPASGGGGGGSLSIYTADSTIGDHRFVQVDSSLFFFYARGAGAGMAFEMSDTVPEWYAFSDGAQLVINPTRISAYADSIQFNDHSLAGASPGDVWTLKAPTGVGYWAPAGGELLLSLDYREALLKDAFFLNSSTDSLTIPVFSNATAGGTHELLYLPNADGTPGRLYGAVRSNDGDGTAEVVRWNNPLVDLTDYDVITGTGGPAAAFESGENLLYSRLQNKFIMSVGDVTYARDEIVLYEFGPDDNTMSVLTTYDPNDGFTSGSVSWLYDDTAANKTYIYVLEGSYTPELHVFDYDAPATPIATVNVSGDANSLGHSIVGDGEQIFMGHAFGAPGFFSRFSMANPAAPTNTQTIAVPNVYAFTDDLALAGDYVFAATETAGAGLRRLFRFNKYDLTDTVSYPIGQENITSVYYDGEYVWLGSNSMGTDTIMARFEPESERLELFGAQAFPGVGSFNEIVKVADDVFFVTSWNGSTERGGIARFSVPRTNTEVIYFDGRDGVQHSINKPVGGALYADSSDVVAVNIATKNVFVDVTGMELGPASKATLAADGITLQRKGTYRVALSASGTGGANTLYEAALFVNGSLASGGASAYLFSGTASAPASGSFNTILSLNAGDELQVGVRNRTSTANWQFYALSFTVEKL